MPLPIAPILPINGVPDELLKAINDRLRRLEAAGGAGIRGEVGPAGPPGGGGGEDTGIAYCW